MSQYPEIKNTEYHEMSFDDVDKIREKVASGKVGLLIKETELLLYLNQMEKKYSSKLRLIQNISIIGFVGTFVFIFINWKLSPLIFVISIIAHIYSRKLARQYIYKQCAEDRVFLKFALGVGLVKVQE
jgi:ABC-type multidrug transport system fused ATPase/permease subunit